MADDLRVISMIQRKRDEASSQLPPSGRFVVAGPCPGCRRRTELRRSRSRGILEHRLLAWLGRRPYRCLSCGRRFSLRASRIDETWEKGPIEIHWNGFLSCNDRKSNGELLLELASAERALDREGGNREGGKWRIRSLSR